jgi:AraC-like DNA-binding protein
LLTSLRQSAEKANIGSSADRWVLNVIKGCLAEDDPKTLKRWAEEARVSYTTLRESCTLVGIGPHEARNLMRMLRAVLHIFAYGTVLDTLLDTGDSRTLADLIATAGFQSASDLRSASIREFFHRQRFVAEASPALLLLQDLVLRHVR